MNVFWGKASTWSLNAAQTDDGRWWWFPNAGDNTTSLASMGFAAGATQVTCAYVSPYESSSGVYAWTLNNPATSTAGYATSTFGVELDGDPTLSFANGDPSAGSWVSSAQAVTLDVGNVSSGDNPVVSCITPSGLYTGSANGSGSVTIPAAYGSGTGDNIYTCDAVNEANEQSANETLTFNVDAQTPTGGISNPTKPGSGNLVSTVIPDAAWNTSNANYTGVADYTVTVGPSGLASGQCVVTDTDSSTYPGSGIPDPNAGDSNASQPYQLTGPDALSPPTGATNPTSGGGTYQFAVPLYQGQNSVQCSVTNGVSVTTTSPTHYPLVDSVMPSIAFTGGPGTYTNGNTVWINSPTGQIDLTALAGASGLASPLTGAEAGEGPAEDPNDNSIYCAPNNSSVQVGSPVSTSLLTTANLTSAQVSDGFVTGVQDVYQPSGSGLTTLSCVSMNGAGIYQDSPITSSVGVDTTVPVTTLSNTAGVSATADDWTDNWQASAPTITVDASTSGASGIQNVVCTVNGDPVTSTASAANPTSGAGGYEYTLPASALTNGPNALSCVSTSGADLTSPADSQTLNLDTTRPAIGAAGLPANGWQTAQDVSFDATTGPSGIASVVCTVDGGQAQTYTPAPGTASWSVGVPLGGNGEHSADCRITNGAGTTVDSGQVTIGADNQTPGITWTGVPASQWVSSTVPVTVTGTAGPSGVQSVSCQVDGGTWNTTTGAASTVSIMTSGQHTIDCYDQSRSGLTSPVESQQVEVDTVAPSQSFSGAPASTWLTNSSDQSVTLNATAGPSGVQAIDCTIDGVAQAPVNPSNERYDSSDGTYSAAAAFAITGNGRHVLSCRTINGANAATATQTEAIDIDASTPSIQLTDGGQPLSTGWVSGDPQTVTAAAIVGPSGVSPTAYSGQGGLECSVDGGAEQVTANASEQLAVNGDGPHSINCAVTDAGNVSYTLPTQTLRIDSVQPSVALSGATFNREVSSDQTVVVTAQAGQSGLGTPMCYVDGNLVQLTPESAGAAPTPAAPFTAAAAWTFPVAGTRVHQVQCDETNGASATASTGVQLVEITNAPPNTDGQSPLIDGGNPAYSDGPSQTSWSSGSESLTITANPPAGAAAITSIDCGGAAGLQGSGNYPADPSNEVPANASHGQGEQITVTVGDPGGNLDCTATDAANNTYQLGSYAFLVDSHAPTGQVLPRAQWPEPNEVALSATDGTGGSGVKAVALTLVGQGLHDAIPVSYDQASGHWIGVIDDGSIHAGRYTLTVKATDNAGNTGTIAREKLTLPLRASTSLTVSARFSTRARTRGVSRKAALRRGTLTTPYGQKITVSGSLLNTKTRRPLAHAQLIVSGTPASGGAAVTLAKISTNAAGSYSYALPAAESRTVTVAYPGSSTALAAAVSFRQRVPGEVIAKLPPRLVVGRTAVLTGRVLGGYVPKHGVQIHVEYQIPGQTRGWSLFQATHTSRTGRFAVRFPISTGAEGYTYRLRVVIPAQSGWPFQAAASTTLVRKIGGEK